MSVVPAIKAMSELKITRRKLPHWKLEGSYYFITFTTIDNLQLSNAELGAVFSHILRGANKFYELHACVVMPDHAHLILKPLEGIALSSITKGIKGVSSRLINRMRDSAGSIWLDESYDRIIRNDEEYFEKMQYIVNNPIKAGLTKNGAYPYLFVLGQSEIKQ
jgi:REP element-mobilizing transposase RayT